MRSLKFLATSTLVMLTACNASPREEHAAAAEQENWVDLFNGHTLEGWTPKFRGHPAGINYRNTFRVEDGILRVRYENWETFAGEFGHLVFDNTYSHYLLEVEYRFIDEQVKGGPEWARRNNGIMYHAQSAAEMTLDQDFPASMEYQLLGGNGTDQRSTVNLCTPGTRFVMNGELRHDHCVNSDGPTFHGDQWVTVQLRVDGSELAEHIVDGEVVMRYTDLQREDGTPLNGGHIAIQAETHPTDFRRIRLLNLEGCMNKDSAAYKSYFIKHDAESC